MRNLLQISTRLLIAAFVLLTSSAFSQTVAKLEINPSTLNLGEWPIGGWQEEGQLTFYNDGPGDIMLLASELDDANGVFAISDIYVPLYIFEETSINLGVSFIADSGDEGEYYATYVANWQTGKSVTTANIIANAYMPIEGDIYENPFEISIPFYDIGISTDFPMRANYHIPNASNNNDIVYKFTLTGPKELDITISNATTNTSIAIYAEDFNGEGGPKSTNAIAAANNILTDAALFSGTYYLVISASEANTSLTFDINIEDSEMPNSIKAYNPTPVDGATNVPYSNFSLKWEFGDFTQQYRLYCGTTYPPDLLVDWTSDLNIGEGIYIDTEPFINHYWRVDVTNGSTTVIGDTWQFTTGLNPPTDLTVTIVEVAEDEYNVVLNWSAPAKTVLSYNVYRDGAMIGTTSGGVTTYTDEDVAYNMDPCYQYTVEAIFDQGVSGSSITASACITGVGNIEGTVTALMTGEPISGADLNINSYQVVTDMYGHYSLDLLEGIYDITASANGFITEVRSDVQITYNTSITEDFILGEYPYEADTVWATQIDADHILIEWDTISNANYGVNHIIGYNIYRKRVSDPSLVFLGTTIEAPFTDNTWGLAPIGIYKWAIEIIYAYEISSLVYSNTLDKDMYCTVGVELSLDDGESPEGAIVLFTNISEPYFELYYEVNLDGTGQYLWGEWHKGIYDVSITLPGYNEMYFSNIPIFADTIFIWGMQKTFYPPANLYVTPVGMATWQEGAYIPFVPLFEDFNTQESFNLWEVVVGGSTSDTWQWTTEYNGSSLDGTPFAFVNSDGAGSGSSMDELLISPAINASMINTVYIEWDQNYQNLSGQDHFTVEVFDGANWIEIYYQDEDDDDWPIITHKSISVSSYENEEFKIRFHYVAPGWNWNLGIDNVYIHSSAGKTADNEKELHIFKIWHDGVFSNDVDTTFYQYGTNSIVDILEEGETYIAKVATLYSQGLFGPSEYEWTYMPSSSFPGPLNMDAYNPDGTDDIVIIWSDLPFDPNSLNKDDELFYLPNKTTLEVIGTNVYRNEELLAFVPTPDTFYIDENVPPNNFYTYCVASVYTEDGGEHTWTSPTDTLCIEDITGGIGDCEPPQNLVAENLLPGQLVAFLEWNEPSGDLVDFLGYNIYRDGDQINEEIVIDTSYEDPHEWNAELCYEITALYTACESDPSNEACLVIIPGLNILKSQINIYPNPAKDYLKIESSEKIYSIAITNYMGQIVSSHNEIKSNEIRIETSNLNAGLYLVEIETKAGIEKIKIIISK